jgi:hypothetical protein
VLRPYGGRARRQCPNPRRRGAARRALVPKNGVDKKIDVVYPGKHVRNARDKSDTFTALDFFRIRAWGTPKLSSAQAQLEKPRKD